MSYITLFQCSLGRSPKTGLTVVSDVIYTAVPYIFSQNGDVNYLSVNVSTNLPGYCNVNEKGTYLIFQYLVTCPFPLITALNRVGIL